MALLATSIASLQKLVDICDSHAAENDLLFSTDPDPLKSKRVCIAFHCTNKDKLANIKLNDDPLPWKTSSKYIGNTLYEDATMDTDIRIKRATFINTCMNLNNEFCFIKPSQQVKLLRIYNSHFSGSSSWNFNSSAFRQLISSWNINLTSTITLFTKLQLAKNGDCLSLFPCLRLNILIGKSISMKKLVI